MIRRMTMRALWSVVTREGIKRAGRSTVTVKR
jgi:hypothetical protein